MPSKRFDIALLAERLKAATISVARLARERHLRLGYFGTTTGAATAIRAAADAPPHTRIDAVMVCEKRLEVIPGATHLFPEPRALERVGELAGRWFCRHFAAATQSTLHGHVG